MSRFLMTIILIFLVFLTSLSQTSNKNNYGTNDPEAEKILNEVGKKYKSLESAKANLTLTIISPEEDLTEELTGTLYLKGNKYKLELGDQEIICDDKVVWTYLKDVNEVQINNFEPDENTINPRDLFTLYETGFLYALTGENVENGRAVQVIDLTPHDKDNPYFKIRLKIDKLKKEIFKTIVFDKNGNNYIYEIKKFSSNLIFSDAFFTFDPKQHPGIEIVDLR